MRKSEVTRIINSVRLELNELQDYVIDDNLSDDIQEMKDNASDILEKLSDDKYITIAEQTEENRNEQN